MIGTEDMKNLTRTDPVTPADREPAHGQTSSRSSKNLGRHFLSRSRAEIDVPSSKSQNPETHGVDKMIDEFQRISAL